MKIYSSAASSLAIPAGGHHPNKMPFSGILTYLNQPSDSPPGGSGGKRIIVTAEAGRKALSTLIGMAVNTTPHFDGHDNTSKIGIITSADIVGNAVVVSGHVYEFDFPKTAAEIKDRKADLGLSFEAQRVSVLDPANPPGDVPQLVFAFTQISAKLAGGAGLVCAAAAASAGGGT